MADVEVFEIDDDFDPLEDMGMEMPDETDDAQPDTDYQMPIPDADKSVVPEKRELPARERIEKLLAGMPGQGPRLLEVIRCAREEIDARDLAAALDEAFPRDVSVYSSMQLVCLLEEAGALAARIEEAAEDAASPCSSEDPADEGAPCAIAGEHAASEDEACGDRAADAPEDAASGEEGEGYLVPAPEPVCFYAATPEGLAVLEERGGFEAVRAMLLEEPRYLPLFEEIIDLVSAPGGASMKALDAAINANPLCENPRRFCGYFLGKLERLGAVRFEGSWVATPLGLQARSSDVFSA